MMITTEPLILLVASREERDIIPIYNPDMAYSLILC